MSELKPCPFCGGEDLLVGRFKDTHAYYVSCVFCGCQAIDNLYEDLAQRRWNTRADHIPDAGKMVAENARLKELLRWCRNHLAHIVRPDSYINEWKEIEKILQTNQENER